MNDHKEPSKEEIVDPNQSIKDLHDFAELLCERHLHHALDLSTFKSKDVFFLKGAFVQGAICMFNSEFADAKAALKTKALEEENVILKNQLIQKVTSEALKLTVVDNIYNENKLLQQSNAKLIEALEKSNLHVNNIVIKNYIDGILKEHKK